MQKAENTSIFIQEVVDVTSVNFAQKLVENFRGQRFYVPRKTPYDKHRLHKVFAKEELELLINNFGGETIDIPMSLTNEAPLRKARILELKAKKYSVQDIAAETNCCWRWVQKVLQNERERMENERNQGNLFNYNRERK